MRRGNLENQKENYKKNTKKADVTYKKGSKKNKKRQVIVMLIWLAITIFIYFQTYKLVKYTLGSEEKEKLWLYNGLSSVISLFNVKEELTEEDFNLKFAALGDVYATTNMISGAKTTDGYDFLSGTENVAKILNEYDLVTASLNTPIADKTLGYTSKSVYNSPVEILDMLKSLNVSVLATATSHALDKNEKGLTQTINNIESKELEQIGLNVNEEASEPLVISKNEINIGVLSYTVDLDDDFTSDEKALLNVFDEEKVKEDVEKLKSKNVDYIVAYLNMPNDETNFVSSEQKENVEILFKNGVSVVLGTGSVVVQDSIEDVIEDNGVQSYIYGIYSLGDFVGGYQSTDAQLSLIANIEFTKKITKNKKGEIVETSKDINIKNPITLWTEVDKKYQKEIYILDDIIQEYETGNSDFTEKEYNILKEAQLKIQQNFN